MMLCQLSSLPQSPLPGFCFFFGGVGGGGLIGSRPPEAIFFSGPLYAFFFLAKSKKHDAKIETASSHDNSGKDGSETVWMDVNNIVLLTSLT